MSDPGERPQSGPAGSETSAPQDDPHAQDDLIGFTSPSALRGTPRVAPAEPELSPLNRVAAFREQTLSSPGRADATPERSSRDKDRPLYPFAIYALILSAVPTLGVSAAVALFAVITRPTPTDPVGQSHALYQLRTLWVAAIGAVVGVVLIMVNLGVPLLFMVAVWVLVRGGWGLNQLSRDRAIKRPDQWLIGAR